MTSSKKSSTDTSVSFPLPPTKNIFGRYFFTEKEEIPLSNLIEVQLESFKWFLAEGLKELLEEISPITDFSGKKTELHFLNHTLENPKIDPVTAKRKNLSYEANIKAHVQLIDKETGEIKEQDVYVGVIPLMTDKGTFIVNGIERVVVNQLVRSPGVFYSKNSNVPKYYNAKIIPKRGAWLELETDKKGAIYAKIDRKRKFAVTQLFRIFGYEKDSEILELFSDLSLTPENDFILMTLEKDSAKTVADAYQSIYRKIRPGDLATAENAKSLIDSMFFDFKKYDMGPIARYKLNKRFGLKIKDDIKHRVFQVQDLVEIVRYLICLNNGEGQPDDIDHLSSRRVRSVGELVQNKFRIGLLRMDRIVKDRMTMLDFDEATANQLINPRPITASMREFFASSQLSQFMDQTNPLAELAHKRRLSAMGPGGLSRERASFDVRDVHTSHYGRICPIATPEGPNIGLVLHLATYARVNKYGFIETPFKTVLQTAEGTDLAKRLHPETFKPFSSAEIKKLSKEKEVLVAPYLIDETKYYDADEEEGLCIAQASTHSDENGNFIHSQVSARENGEAEMVEASFVTHIDISPRQIISETTALIPFLEHDDNTRASMGSNMQRQSVSLISPDAPFVGTGMERVIAIESGQSLVARQKGEVVQADARTISVVYENGEKIIYELDNFVRSNQATAINMRCCVVPGQKVQKRDPLADGTAIQNGEIALGRNLLVAYMTWGGYNFEDAIIISDSVVQKGLYDTVHIENYTIDMRDTKLGPEEITRDIPNVGELKLKDLDVDGIVRVGATVSEGDILVGKITPKGETELTAEERLLQAIFGEKSKDVKDTSLRLPGGSGGKVVDIQIFSRSNGDDLPNGVIKQIRVFVAQTRKVQIGDKFAGRHGNKGVVSRIVPREDMPFLEDGTPVDIILNPLGVSSRMNIGQVLEAHLGLAAQKLNVKFATPALNGIPPKIVQMIMKHAGISDNGKVQLYDGLTGEPFSNKTTVGIAYILKLHHLVEDKIHARSVGPYSLVTQQPLGGKAQNGGQRFGEMEVWALEAYGAAHTLQEMLTIKSDDVSGRAQAYEDIVKGNPIRQPSVPESFNVLVKELQSLGLSVDLMSLRNSYIPPELENEDEVTHVELKEVSEQAKILEVPEEDMISELQDTSHESDEEIEQELTGEADEGLDAASEMKESLEEDGDKK